jgi:aryl-alcohol dehydrogenase-like predicted oxidoreductase
LIECLSSIGREHLDFYFVRMRRGVEEYQISGVLQALELAKQEGHVKHIGLCCDGSAFASLAMWQFHDAFEVLLVPRNARQTDAYETLAPLAQQRRVGIVTSRPFNWGFGLPFFELPGEWRIKNLTQSFYGLSLPQATLAHYAKDHPVLVGVRSAAEVAEALGALSKSVPDGVPSALAHYLEAYESDEVWARIQPNDEKELVEALARRNRGRDVLH